MMNINFFYVHNMIMKKAKKNKKDDFVSRYDPNGMYTGNTLEDGEPIQDADDL